MYKLLKADFFKLRKDFMTKVFVIISIGTALLTILIFFLNKELAEIFNPSFDDLFISGVSLSQNVGILYIIACPIFVAREFSQHTIRNKVISGHSKKNILFSNCIISVIISLLLYISYEFICLAIGLPLFGVSGNYSVSDFFLIAAISIMVISTLSVVASTITVLTKSAVISIFSCLFGIISATGVLLIFKASTTNQTIIDILNFITKVTFFGQPLLIGEVALNELVWWSLGSSVVTIGITLLVGTYIFEKSDLK